MKLDRVMFSEYFWFFIIIIFSLLAYEADATSTYGKPSEFGNASTTTCWIGGDTGNISCTGTIYAPSFLGNVSTYNSSYVLLNSSFYDLFLFSYNESRAFNQSIELTNSYISLWDSSYNTTYDLIRNASSICSSTEVLLGNGTCFDIYGQEWITPAQILDVDDEDIEGDLNTYVDIAGDTMVGALVVQAIVTVANIANEKYLQFSGSAQDAVIKFFDSSDVLEWEIRDDNGDFKINNRSNAGNMFSIESDDGMVTIPFNLTVDNNFWTSNFKITNSEMIVDLNSSFCYNCYNLTVGRNQDISPFNLTLGSINVTENMDLELNNLTTSGLNLGENDTIYLGDSEESKIYYNGSSLILEVN